MSAMIVLGIIVGDAGERQGMQMWVWTWVDII